MTVLLVEDEDDIREIIRDSLEERGCLVLASADGAAALEQCARHDGPIHLLLDRHDDAWDERARAG